MDGSSCSFSSLFRFLVTLLATAQTLQVLKQCPFGHGEISGVVFGNVLGLSYSNMRARYLNILKNLVHGILKISLP